MKIRHSTQERKPDMGRAPFILVPEGSELSCRLLTALLLLPNLHWRGLLPVLYCPSSWLALSLSLVTFRTPGSFLLLKPTFATPLLISFTAFPSEIFCSNTSLQPAPPIFPSLQHSFSQNALCFVHCCFDSIFPLLWTLHNSPSKIGTNMLNIPVLRFSNCSHQTKPQNWVSGSFCLSVFTPQLSAGRERSIHIKEISNYLWCAK